MSDLDALKDKIVENQKIIDELNRKTREVKIIQEISAEINSILDLSVTLTSILESLERVFQFRHSMILLLDEETQTLKVTASHGFDGKGIGAEVKMGEGMIGVVAKRKKIMRMGNIGVQMAYTAAVRKQMEESGRKDMLGEKIKLPGLPDVQSQVAIPLLIKERLTGVLAVESNQPNVFDERDETIITIIANQAASAIENARLYASEKEKLIQLNEVNNALQELNESLEEKVKERTAEVTMQKEIVERKNKEVMDSITYAKRIQDTILPLQSYVNEHLPESFVLFEPKDIVSGDFYWVNKKNEGIYFSAIDCTGHGVPGALVSIVAHNLLQRAVILFQLKKPSEILDSMNEAVEEGFNRKGQGIRDGMDIALCKLNREEMTLEFSGANNSVYIINSERKTWSEGAVVFADEPSGAEWKGDKQPIGFHETKKKFSNHLIQLQKGDNIYVFSDGYADQFGGPKGKKFMSRRMKELLVSIHKEPMDKQKQILEKTMREWRGNIEQVDDVCVIGVRV